MTRHVVRLALLLTLAAVTASFLPAEEGMWPMSEIHQLDLEHKGLQIPVDAIYNPDGISLVEGICKIGGCTGSFVSPDGLILTNHHCGFRAVQNASTTEHDYLTNGFMAADRSREIPAKGYTVRITESYRDVSAQVLSVVKTGMEPADRTRAIDRKINEIVVAAEKAHPGKRAEVSEMFAGKTYVLFLYTYLKDVRLVYAPPRAIGEYGGEEDNWIWPRHTGDFTFMRAYVGPDGQPAEYSADNRPYHPRKYIQVAPDGVNEGDFIFIFGYPGRTYRHRPAAYMDYEYHVRMPWVVDWYGWQIATMEKMGAGDPAVALRLASRIKGLANTWKNYRGKIRGIGRIDLLERKQTQEQKLVAWIEADPGRAQRYGDVLGRIAAVYRDMRATAERELTLTYLKRSSVLLMLASSAYEASRERGKPEVDRESAWMDRNFPQTVKRLQLSQAGYHQPTDRAILKALLLKAAALPADQRIAPLDKLVGGGLSPQAIGTFIDKAYGSSRLSSETVLTTILAQSPAQLESMADPFMRLAVALYPEYEHLRETQKRRKGELDALEARLLDAKQAFLGQDFVPDANSTLRFTYGHIKGYSPADAVVYKPITTLGGVIEKNTGKPPYNAPERLIQLYRARDFGRFASPRLKNVPVAILYDADTTGGNSGSPVFNARGQLVGVNFDRAWEATINDYAWNESYSRSIAVDIRYVLWVLWKYSGANSLLQEMGVSVQ